MDQSELLSLLISLSSLVVVVAVLIGLFSAVVKFVNQYGLFIAGLVIAYFMFKGAGVDVTWVDDIISMVITEVTRFER